MPTCLLYWHKGVPVSHNQMALPDTCYRMLEIRRRRGLDLESHSQPPDQICELFSFVLGGRQSDAPWERLLTSHADTARAQTSIPHLGTEWAAIVLPLHLSLFQK